MLRQLRRLSARNTPPLPSRLAQLPTAHGRRYTRGPRVYPTRIPARPSTPPQLADRQALAERLRRPRPLRLQRPELHRRHDHAEIPVLVELVARYVLGEAPQLYLAPPAPYARWVISHRLDRLETETAKHRWGQLWRIDDVRRGLGLPLRRRAW